MSTEPKERTPNKNPYSETSSESAETSEPGRLPETEWSEEQARVDHVTGEISDRISHLEREVGNIRTDIVDVRKNFWDDVTVNFEDFNEVLETYTSIKQQADILSEKERRHRQAQQQLRVFSRLQKSPYFGRIDFVEGADGAESKARADGPSEVERIYIGIGSFRDADDDFLIYDWRAPICSMYYDFTPGPAEYETPMGKISGRMDVKRQYIIKEGVIKSLFDAWITIGDELLQEVLGKNADTQMRSIVATIQTEQNRMIRNEKSRLLIVQGVAGSGKTSAALQRVAYLLYRHRDTLRSENIMLFSPNPMFNSYVSTVLPELGEENMQQTTFQEYLNYRLRRTFELEDGFTQLEYVHTAMNKPGYDIRLESIRFKASEHFLKLMDQYATALRYTGMVFRDVEFRGSVWVSAEQIETKFYSYAPTWSIPNRLSQVVEWLLQEVKAKARLEREQPWVEDEIELLSKEDYLRAFQELRRKKGYTEESFDDHHRERAILIKYVIRKTFQPILSAVKQLEFIDIPAIYKQLFEMTSKPLGVAGAGMGLRWGSRSGSRCGARANGSGSTSLDFVTGVTLPDCWQEIADQTIDCLNESRLMYEDSTPYLYLQDRIEGFQTNTSVRHVFIDEAQDYSPFQFHFIRRLFPYARFTLLGDPNQSIYTHSIATEEGARVADLSIEGDGTGTGFSWVASLYNSEDTETFTYMRSYRSTKQIVEFTRELIVSGESIIPFNRHGEKPTLTNVMDKANLALQIANRIQSLQANGYRNIAVICKTAAESKEAFELLNEALVEMGEGPLAGDADARNVNDVARAGVELADLQPRTGIRLVNKETSTFENGTVVIPAYLAKGVEFDAVIIYNASAGEYGRAIDRLLLYTACTRAMHSLHVYYVGEVSPFIAEAPNSTYQLEGQHGE